jgi:hypothetical protein
VLSDFSATGLQMPPKRRAAAAETQDCKRFRSVIDETAEDFV